MILAVGVDSLVVTCEYLKNNFSCRDGVGDGQINYVLEHEIKAIEKCFQAAGINQADLKFTYIIVSKRINTRFFR